MRAVVVRAAGENGGVIREVVREVRTGKVREIVREV